MRYSRKTIFLCLLSTALAYCVIVLGAYVRLSDAGLGCPDWPGCYGRAVVPAAAPVVEQANQAYPDRPLHQARAWKEMIHRYAAGTLGLLILLLAINAWAGRKSGRKDAIIIPTTLVLLVIFQAALGMWTVTLLLKPVVVVAHLLGGMLILGLLYWYTLNALGPVSAAKSSPFTPWVLAGLAILYGQIALGGWTSANYSALICTDFPTCQGQWWPQMNFSEGFMLWRGAGVDYQGGVLDATGRTAVHVSHRLGALLTFVVLATLAVKGILTKQKRLLQTGLAVILILVTQISLGIANVLLALPLPIAVAHNGVAALLLLALITLLYFSFNRNHQAGY